MDRTDPGTASAHFVQGGRVKGRLYGLPPALKTRFAPLDVVRA